MEPQNRAAAPRSQRRETGGFYQTCAFLRENANEHVEKRLSFYSRRANKNSLPRATERGTEWDTPLTDGFVQTPIWDMWLLGLLS